MALILPPSLRQPGQQPRGPVAVDWFHPINSRMQACIDGRNRYDLVTQAGPESVATSGGTFATAAGLEGTAFTNDSDYYLCTDALNGSPSEYTWLVYSYIPDYTTFGFGGLLAKTTDFGTSASWQSWRGTSDGLLRVENNASEFVTAFDASDLDGLHVVTTRWDGTNIVVNIDGSANEDIGTQPQDPPPGVGWLKVYNNRDTDTSDGTHFLTRVWDRCLSLSEIEMLVADPWLGLRETYSAPLFTPAGGAPAATYSYPMMHRMGL